jgi:hypothetical protein
LGKTRLARTHRPATAGYVNSTVGAATQRQALARAPARALALALALGLRLALLALVCALRLGRRPAL